MNIREWIDNPSDFDEGLKLYNQYGTHGNLKRILARAGDTARNRKTLIYELTKLIGKDEGKPKTAAAPLAPTVRPPIPKQKVIQVPGKESVIIYDSEEEKKHQQLTPEMRRGINDVVRSVDKPDLAALDKQWKDLWKKAHYIKTQLPHYQTKEQRSDACGQILSMLDECEVIWKKIDHFKEHGSLPEESSIQVQDLNDPISLMKRRTNLKTYICHGKKGTKAYTPEKIAEFESELEQVEEKLKTMVV